MVVVKGRSMGPRNHHLEMRTVNMYPALSTDTAAHFDLGVDRLATPVEIAEMADPWVGIPGSAVLGSINSPTPIPSEANFSADMPSWVRRLDLPGV